MRLWWTVFSCLTSEIAEHHCWCSPSGKHSVWGRGGRRNLYHHWDPDNKTCKGQNSLTSITECSNMHKHSQKGFAESRCVVVFQLLGVDGSALREALTHKKLTAKGEEVTVFVSMRHMFSAAWCILWCVFKIWCCTCICIITDDQPAKLWAGNICPWCLSQGCVRSDLHLVGGENQPVAGSEGALTALITTQRQQCKFHYNVVGLLLCSTTNYMMCTLYVMQDEIYHSNKGSSVIGLLDIYGFEVLQHNR